MGVHSFSLLYPSRLQRQTVLTGSLQTITVANRFSSPSLGYGVEQIEFSNGVVWTLEDILAATSVSNGTGAGNDSLTGTSYADNLYGLAGNDTLTGNAGDDFLVGGTGSDFLDGVSGSDTYRWSRGDGNDTISDSSNSLLETDTLAFTDVKSTEVQLTRVNGSKDLLISIPGTPVTEVITVNTKFPATVAGGKGIEVISFSDGVTWQLIDIFANTVVNGTTGNDSLLGTNYRDNLYGLDGADTLVGNDGDDLLIGGKGVDSLVGGNGNDSYKWSKGDGNDTILDSSASLLETDTLYLVDAIASDVVSCWRSGNDLKLDILSAVGTETLTVTNFLLSTTAGYGIESIQLSDGTNWTHDTILLRTSTGGGGGNDTIVGTGFLDTIYGLGGNDSLSGGNGDDHLIGGTGADVLIGGAGVDIASYYQSTQGVKVSLLTSTGQVGVAGGEENGDILSGIEALEGSAFADDLTGDNSSNNLYGLAGDDTLTGNDGTDLLYGGVGNDLLNGGTGSDILVGGAGADIIRFTDINFGNDVVSDYEDGVDHLSFGLNVAHSFADFTITGNGTTAVTVTLGANSIVLDGLAPITLATDDFLFV